MPNWDLDMETNVKVWADAHSTSETKRGDWMKKWMMLQGYTALNAMYRKTPQKQTTFISTKGKEKQIDCILTKRRYLRHAKDAEERPQMRHGQFHDQHA